MPTATPIDSSGNLYLPACSALGLVRNTHAHPHGIFFVNDQSIHETETLSTQWHAHAERITHRQAISLLSSRNISPCTTRLLPQRGCTHCHHASSHALPARLATAPCAPLSLTWLSPSPIAAFSSSQDSYR